MASRSYDFNNLDLFSCQDLDYYGSLSPEHVKPLRITAIPPAEGISLQNQEDFFYQKSSQNLVSCYEISFEKNFMKEHQRVFERELQNYMESFRIYSNKTQGLLTLQNQLLSEPQKQSQTCIEFITAHGLAFTHEQTRNFVKKFDSFDKLSEFLNIVVSICPKSIAIQLIMIAKELLEKYESLLFEDQDETLLLNMASNIAESPKFVELTNLKRVSLTKCKEATALIANSKKFLEVYCATTIFVIAQYFENPYSSEEMGCFKRQLSPWSSEDDESQEVERSSTASKKRKFSF